MNIKRNNCEFSKEEKSHHGTKKRKRKRGKGRRMVETTDERGLGRAYVISDSTFERVKRIPAILLSLAR